MAKPSITFIHVLSYQPIKQAIKQVSKKTDFTADFIWWGLLRLISNNMDKRQHICHYILK